MSNPKASVSAQLRKIRASLDNWSDCNKRVKYATWLSGEVYALSGYVSQALAGSGAQSHNVVDKGQQVGGEGVATGASPQELDHSTLTTKISQCEPKSESPPSYTITVGHARPIMTFPVFQDARGQNYTIETTPPPSPSPHETPAQTAPKRLEWPSESLVTVLGAVPNPRFVAVTLADGRLVSMLKGAKSEWKKGVVVKSRLHPSGTEGCPIYEAVAND